MKQKKIIYVAVSFGVIMLCFTFLAYLMGKKTRLPITAQEVTTIGDADSVVTETFVLLSSDGTTRSLVLQRPDDKTEQVTVTWNASTEVKNRYGEVISTTVLKEGEILNVKYDKETLLAGSVIEDKDSWEYTGIKKLRTNQRASLVMVGSEKYLYTKNLVVRSAGKGILLQDVDEVDEVTLRGMGNQLYSIAVDKGHGYVKLTNEDFYEGGWVEFGQAFIKPVEKNMNIVLQEGTYKMTIANDGIGGSVDVEIKRDETKEIDVSKINYQAMELGSIRFNITPADAQLYVDGAVTDYEQLVTLSYGSHRIQIVKEGYDTFSGTLYVKETLRTLNFVLTPYDNTAQETETPVAATATPTPSASATIRPYATISPVITPQPTVKAQTNQTTTADAVAQEQTKEYYIYVNKPQGAEVYLDGSYVGLTPVSMKKVAGVHTITLSKSGYKTRTYNVTINDEKADVSYTFADMEKEE